MTNKNQQLLRKYIKNKAKASFKINRAKRIKKNINDN